MLKRFYPDLLWILAVVVAAGLGWLLVHQEAVPNTRAAVAQALHHAQPTDLESVTVYPLVAGPGPGPARPFQVQAPAQLRALLPALQQLRPIKAVNGTFAPLLEATVVVRLVPRLADAWHLSNRSIIFRLAVSGTGEVAQLAQTNDFYEAAALGRQLALLRDSLARR